MSSIKITLISLIFSNAFSIKIFCQDSYVKTVIPGKTWELREEWGSMFPAHRYKLFVSCDTTVLNGNTYHDLELEDIYQQQHCGIGGYVREDTVTKKVYYISLLEEENLREILIADYSLEKGDTFNFENGWGKAVVQKVDYIDFGSPNVKRISFGTGVLDALIEGVGRQSSGIIDGCSSYGWVTRIDREEVNCNVVTDNELIEKSNFLIRISPNPAKDQMRVDINNIQSNQRNVPYQILGINGIILQRGLLNQKTSVLSLTTLPKGVLVIVVEDKDQVSRKKFIHY